MDLRVCVTIVGAGLLVGCAGESPRNPSPDDPKVRIQAPGVDVKVGPGGKTDVRAPGADVKVDPK